MGQPEVLTVHTFSVLSCMKGRFIGENIRLIDGVINFAEAENIPGLLLFLHFEKAFDTVEWALFKKPFNSSILVPL